MILDFFKELDERWKPAGAELIRLQVIGSTALFLQYDYERGTKDSDILETTEISEAVSKQFKTLAGKGTVLAKRYGMYLDIVRPAILFLPTPPQFHPHSQLNDLLRNFRIEVLDGTDVVISKLKRFSANDVDDIRHMIRLGAIQPERLVERFQSAVEGWLMDARAEDLPRYIENLHTVQRDFLLVQETSIALPRWLSPEDA